METSAYLASETIKKIHALMKSSAVVQSRTIELITAFEQYSQEQRLRPVQSIIEALERIWDTSLELSVLYERNDQRLDHGRLIVSVSDMRLTAKQIRSAMRRKSYSTREFDRDRVRLSSQARSLSEGIQSLAQSSAECILATMPISVSDAMAERITYEQIRLNPQAAIQHAFSLFEEHLRRRIKAGANTYGTHLINVAFGSDGCLTYGEMPDEREGVRNLMAGAYAVLRNPRMHRIMEDSETTALAAIALVDLMIQIVDEAEKLDSQGVQNQ